MEMDRASKLYNLAEQKFGALTAAEERFFRSVTSPGTVSFGTDAGDVDERGTPSE